MPEIEPEDDGTLDPDEEARAATLTEAQLRTIDECILSNITYRLQKTARVVVLTMRTLGEQFPELPPVFYSGRIFYSKPFGHLAAAGLIEAAGNLNRMRFSEVRLAPTKTVNSEQLL